MRFTKMQGVGNDFVVLSEPDIAGASYPDLARTLCERKFSIGADGLLVIGAPSHIDAAFSFRMFNPDGSEDMCGNGLRCAALWSSLHRGVPLGDFLAETKDGLRACELILADSRTAIVRVDMGSPRFLPAELPMTRVDGPSVIAQPIEVVGRIFDATVVNTGSTHTVVFVDALPDDDEFLTYSPPFETNPLFPERTSLIWTMQTAPDRLATRIWERGAGETLGCGTGACAAAVAAVVTGRADRSQNLTVASQGGELTIRWTETLWMTGPATLVYTGSID